MKPEFLRDYAIIDVEMRQLEARKQALRQLILNEMKESGLEKTDSPYGKFTVAHKMSWKYSPKIAAMEEKVKIAKDKEIRKMVATGVETEYLLFKQLDA